jgi:hypothetical protein
MKPRQSSNQREPSCPSCRALIRWIDTGGKMSNQLLRHLATCQECFEWASRISRVHAALTMLTTSAPPTGIIGRANEKALRMLARKLRDNEQARTLRHAKPPAALWPKMEGPLSRTAASAAAACIILSLRAGVANGVEQARDLAQPLADTHYERHIDDGENMMM